MNTEIQPNIYYKLDRLLTYDTLFNMVIGERGNGKTFSLKEYFIKSFINKGYQFVWIRRYETEFDDFGEFFKDIGKKFPNHEFNVKGKKLYCDNKVMGYGIPLSKGITKKSTNYDDVWNIGFDEFIINKGNYHYLKDEVQRLFDLYETIARLRRVKVFMLANSISEINPYFLFFNIRLNGRFTRVNKQLIIERTDTPLYRAVKKDTDFGELIKGTGYDKYAIENEFLEDNLEFIETKTDKAINRFNIQFKNITLGIWIDTKCGKIFASRKHNKTLPIYSLTVDNLRPNYLILKSNSNYMKMLKNAYYYGYMYYEDIKIKGIFREVISYLNIK